MQNNDTLNKSDYSPITFKVLNPSNWRKSLSILIPTTENQEGLAKKKLLNTIEISKIYDKEHRAIKIYGSIGYRSFDRGFSTHSVDVFSGSVIVRVHDGFSRISKRAYDGCSPKQEGRIIMGIVKGLISHHTDFQFDGLLFEPSGHVEKDRYNTENFDEATVNNIILLVNEVIKYGELRYDIKPTSV